MIIYSYFRHHEDKIKHQTNKNKDDTSSSSSSSSSSEAENLVNTVEITFSATEPSKEIEPIAEPQQQQQPQEILHEKRKSSSSSSSSSDEKAEMEEDDIKPTPGSEMKAEVVLDDVVSEESAAVPPIQVVEEALPVASRKALCGKNCEIVPVCAVKRPFELQISISLFS